MIEILFVVLLRWIIASAILILVAIPKPKIQQNLIKDSTHLTTYIIRAKDPSRFVPNPERKQRKQKYDKHNFEPQNPSIQANFGENFLDIHVMCFPQINPPQQVTITRYAKASKSTAQGALELLSAATFAHKTTPAV